MILPAALLAGAIVLSAIINQKGLHRMSQATDRLASSIVALTNSVDALIAKPAPHPDDAAVNAAADAVDALKAKVDAAVAAPVQ